jgi:hypothetical protein
MDIIIKIKHLTLRLILHISIGVLCILFHRSEAFCQASGKLKIRFVDYFYENASPVCWSVQGDSLLKICLMPDYERESLNRQTTHWNFRVEADSGTHLRMSISKMLNEVYNGSPAKEWWDKNHPISCYISYDKKKWVPVMTKLFGGQELLVDLVMERTSIWVARLPVYSLSDLDDLEKRFSGSSFFKVIPVGSTIGGRPLEIIRLGDSLASHSVLIRARAHPWEPGGSWIVEGLINKFLQTKPENWLKSYCVYIMPMANKDGVARGMTRFNAAGMDLNRKWDKWSDPSLCPEKYVLEKFIEELIEKGIRPELGIDIHNDDAGSITFCKHKAEDNVFIKKAALFEKLLRDLTCFSENANFPVQIPGTQERFVMFEDGLYSRYGIPALVWELNANWIASKASMPVSDDWIRSGENLNEVFYQYFNDKKR